MTRIFFRVPYTKDRALSLSLSIRLSYIESPSDANLLVVTDINFHRICITISLKIVIKMYRNLFVQLFCWYRTLGARPTLDIFLVSSAKVSNGLEI